MKRTIGACNKHGNQLDCVFCSERSWQQNSRDKFELAIKKGKTPGVKQCYNVIQLPIQRFLRCRRCQQIACATCLERVYSYILKNNLLAAPSKDAWMVCHSSIHHYFVHCCFVFDIVRFAIAPRSIVGYRCFSQSRKLRQTKSQEPQAASRDKLRAATSHEPRQAKSRDKPRGKRNSNDGEKARRRVQCEMAKLNNPGSAKSEKMA
jgi:hypothetical protein